MEAVNNKSILYEGLHAMTPYHLSFLPIFVVGCLIAAILSFVAAHYKGCLGPTSLMVVGTFAFWVSLFFASDAGYRAWQAMPDPPPEAFSDASVMGALVVGWLPGGVFCLVMFGIAKAAQWLSNWADPKVEIQNEQSASPGSGEPSDDNPFQGPRS